MREVPLYLAVEWTPTLGLCCQLYHYRFYQFGSDNSVIGLIRFKLLTYQRESYSHPTTVSPFQLASLGEPELFPSSGFGVVRPTRFEVVSHTRSRVEGVLPRTRMSS